MVCQSVCARVGSVFGPKGLSFGSCPVQEPGRGEIRIRNEAASLNYADLMMVNGDIDSTGAGRIPLADGAGIVDAIGEGVDGLSVGDLVMARFYPLWDTGPHSVARTSVRPGINRDGHARTYETAPASWYVRAPRNYDAAEAATLGCAALTAWRALFVETHVKPGDWVLTQGTGGVALFALQFARAAGARVIATTSNAHKAGILESLGATEVINYREVPDWGAAAYELADKRGCDAIIDVAGGSQLEQAFVAVREAGYIGQIGVLAGQTSSLSTVPLMRKNARLQGLQVGSLDHTLEMIAAIEANEIRPVIGARYTLDRLGDAFERMSQQDCIGKIVIDI